MGSLMFYCPQDSISAIFEKRLTDHQTNRQTCKLMDREINEQTDGWTKALIEMCGRYLTSCTFLKLIRILMSYKGLNVMSYLSTS